MSIAAGARLGPYQIGEPLGAGGMGEVYRARDTRLDRSVAIKVLPEHLSNVPELRERFEREARTVAALNHPNICTLYDIGSQNGVDFLVIEYLEGETLADRLAAGRGRSSAAAASASGATSGARRPLKIDEALQIALQIADALDKAHRQGVVHRDLKPGNIMLTASGAKLLDFGLAKHAQPIASVSPPAQSVMPTEQRPLTVEGTILGTVQYMAPEQLEGREADARTDIFAFGALLYEMTAGRPAFEGKSHVSLIAAIVDHDPPPISSLAPVSPPLLDHLVKTCLAKNPDRRWQSMADVLIQLKLIVDKGAELASPSATGAMGRRVRIAWGAALLAVVLAASGVTAALMFSRRAPNQGRISFEIPTPATTATNQFALSPSGRHVVAIVSEKGGMLWLRALQHLHGQTLAGTEAPGWPFWSPDGRFVGFFAGGKLRKIDISGAPPQTLCDAPGGSGASWSREDVIVFAPTGNGPLFRVSAAGGVAAPLTELDKSRQETSHRHPYFLPDGRHFLYLAASSKPENSAIFVGSLDSKDRKLVVAATVRAAFAPPDRVLFIRENTLMAQPFDPGRLQLDGYPFPIAEDVGNFPANGAAGFTVSENGLLAYRGGGSSTANNYLRWFDRAGKDSAAVDAPGGYSNPTLAPDRQHIAVARFDGSASGTTSDIWILDLVRGTNTRFTVDPGIDDAPIWSPDGSRIVFRSNRGGGTFDLYQKNVSGVVPEEVLLKSDHAKVPEDWSADGRFLLYRDADPQTGNDLWVLPLTGEKKPEPVVRTQFNEIHGRFSSDGRWIAYVSNESGLAEVYVQGFPKATSRIQISTAGGGRPRWRRDGRELFFTSLTPELMAVDIGASTDGGLKAGIPHKLFAVNASGLWDVTPDGQRFLITAGTQQQAAGVVLPLTVIVNWDRQ